MSSRSYKEKGYRYTLDLLKNLALELGGSYPTRTRCKVKKNKMYVEGLPTLVSLSFIQ